MRRLLPALFALLLVAAACGDDDSSGGSPGATPGTAADSTTTTSVSDDTTVATTADTTSAPPAGGPVIAEGWSATVLGEGTKPVLALDASGVPGVAWLFEEIDEGFVAFASATDGWQRQDVVEGYFYGPIGLAFGAEGGPVIAYHDHQAGSFDPELGDLTVAIGDGAAWEISVARDDGHDGWDSTVAVAPDGTIHAAGIDPVQFDREDGVEHYEFVDGEWVVTAIGAPLIEYAWNVSLAVAPDGSPAMSFHDTKTLDLVFAERVGGEWVLTPVDTEGDVGSFSSLAFDAAGNPVISYASVTGQTSATVRVASRDGAGAWSIEEVADLANLEFGFLGARRVTSLALDAAGAPVVAMGDTTGVWLANRSGDGVWSVDQVVTAGDDPLGQLVSLAVDDIGTAHLAFFEVTSGPGEALDGTVLYITPS